MIQETKPLPEFASEAEERAYWESRGSSDHLDWSKAERARLPNLRSSDAGKGDAA